MTVQAASGLRSSTSTISYESVSDARTAVSRWCNAPRQSRQPYTGTTTLRSTMGRMILRLSPTSCDTRQVARSEAWRGPIPLTLPSLEGDEQAYVAQAVAHGRLAGDGEFTKRSEKFLQEALGVPRVLLTTSCTSALDMAAILLDISSGDEVIVPSFTFVSCANAFVMRGAKPVFADVREDTLNLDETKLEALITPRTKAIVFVNYAGVACAMDALLRIAGAHGVALVEDNAHGLFGAYRGRQLGTFGKLATLSFHETKNFTCGE